MNLRKFQPVFYFIALLFLASCLPEQKIAQGFVKNGPRIRLMVTPPDYVYKYNHKGESIEGFQEMNEKEQDSALYADSRYIRFLSDSLILEDYVNQFIMELRNAGFEVYLPAQMDSFLSDQSQSYMVNIAQVQLDEYNYPYKDIESVEDTMYVKKFDLNAVDFSIWIELSKVNAPKPRKTVLYDSQSAYDDFEGGFYTDPWSSILRYKYHLDTLTVKDVYVMTKYLGKTHGEYLYDFFLNQWIAFNMPQNQNASYFYHYDRKRRMMEITEDEKFQILPDK